MKYFIDTEFIERGHRRRIELISLAAVAEDGRERYLVSREFKPNHTNDWVTANVLPKLPPPCARLPLFLIACLWLDFIGDDPAPEFWGWCSGYDYVVISQLIGSARWPRGWPFYIRDIQQVADQRGIRLVDEGEEQAHDALLDARRIRDLAVALDLTAPDDD